MTKFYVNKNESSLWRKISFKSVFFFIFDDISIDSQVWSNFSTLVYDFKWILIFQVAHMTKNEMQYLDSALIGPAMLFLNQYFNFFIKEYYVLWLCLVSIKKNK